MELYDALCSELAREKYLVSYYDEFIKTAPKGYLVVRERETGSTFYWAYPNGKDGSYKQLNITDQDDLVAQLVKKMIGSKVIAMSKKNIKYMEKLKKNSYMMEKGRESIRISAFCYQLRSSGY